MENLYLIVGLGNPGREYAATRHNAGFLVMDRLAGRWRTGWTAEKKHSCRLARVERDGSRWLLCQPLTYMNASGETVGPLKAYYQVPLRKLLVVVDDADLPLGEIRLRPRGSSGGHHGLESIEQHLGSREYPRLRIGIGRRTDGMREIRDYVLARFDPAEVKLLEKVLLRACEQVECWLNDGIDKAMNRYNGAIPE